MVSALAALVGGSSTAADPVTATRAALEKAKTQAANQPRASMIAREDYLRRQEIVDVRLSPDGRHLSFLRRGEKGVDVMWSSPVCSAARLPGQETAPACGSLTSKVSP
jgi:hypothetical protein